MDRVEFVAAELAALADPERAAGMAAYLKTDMPFYGVQKGPRTPVFREMKRRYPIDDAAEYEGAVLALWAQPHREEKYFAIGIAAGCREFITFDRIPLYRRLIGEGAWWDLVDDLAARCVGPVLLHEREAMAPVIDAWSEDPDMWIRRSALLAHLKHKFDTDHEQLFRHCLALAPEREFFIRKAIGWSLREYAKTAPGRVRDFALEHREELSGLSFREATKHLEV
jgi:3-methyladenine DNA glycosylase AlkD